MSYLPDIDLSNVLNKTVNQVFRPTFRDENRYLVLFGGAGSGKSRYVAQKILYRMIYEQGHRFLVVRKVDKTIKLSVFQLFKDYINKWDVASKFKVTVSPMKITHIASGNTIDFMGVDDPEKLKSIEGITSVWIEEASELEEKDFNELDRRVRGLTPHYKQIIITFNPISHLHWLKKRFYDNPPENCTVLKTTYLDNEFIDDVYSQVLLDMKNYDVQQYNIYALGEWGVLNTNVVYHNYDFKKHSTELSINDFQILHVGLDFNIGGCVGVVCGIHGDKVYVVDGFAVYDTDAIVTQLKSSKYGGKQIIAYPDASGGANKTNSSRSDIQILRDGGFQVMANKSNPAVRDRVNAMNRMFATDCLFVGHKQEKMSYALQTQAYKDNGEPEKFTEHKGGAIDDWNDALGYLIAFKFAINKSRIMKQSISYA